MAEGDLRRIVQARIGPTGQVVPESLNEALRELSKAIHVLEGRSGQVNVRDNLNITTNRKTALDINSSSGGKAAIVAFGTDNSGIALAKGSRRNDEGQWIATDTTSVIWAVSREGWASLYVNTGLRIGEAFEPQVKVTIPGGTNPLLHNDLGGLDAGNDHPAAAITNTPAGLIASTNVQAALNELDTEKLARDGTQTMLGHLLMNHNDVNNVNDEDIESNLSFTGGNSKARIISPTDIELNTTVNADTDYTPVEGAVSWDVTEDAFVAHCQSGSGLVKVALGWSVFRAVNGESPI